MMLIRNERHICFHIATTTCTNTDIENARRSVLKPWYRSTADDPSLYYLVNDSHTEMVVFCLCDPSKQMFGDESCFSMRGQADEVAKWMKTYTVLNAEALHWK